ncbi:MAG TPA: CDP-alcohol phosphatidyltransferase family protein [Aestuariivirgaceae bacterium]|nr:CDP-alcohol phosphatidyltransferase family protein [Aestuariivirgaceae bacterium]
MAKQENDVDVAPVPGKPKRKPARKRAERAALSTANVVHTVAPLSPPPSPSATATAKPQDVATEGQPALCVVGPTPARIWSHTPAERLRIQFRRAGITKIVDPQHADSHPGPVIAVRGDAVLDQPLVPILVRSPNLLLIGEDSSGELAVATQVPGHSFSLAREVLAGREPPPEEIGLTPCRPADLGASFWQGLRKREVPFAFAIDDRNRRSVEWRMFMGTYKGATDIVTKRLWPVPAFYATRLLASAGVTPNVVTTLGALLVAVAFVLFLYGEYGWGLAAAWLMTFLDTVDGKLARTTLTSSKWGDIFDHGIDLVHPPFWYAAWAVGLAAHGFDWPSAFQWSVVAVILGGYVMQRLMEGIAIKWLGMEIHIWRPVDTYFREITARRNPNLILLTVSVIAGRPDVGLIAVAVWTSACLVLHTFQLFHAFAAKNRLGRITSWMSEPPRQE